MDPSESALLTLGAQGGPVRLGHYVLLHRLGRGGMGVVYAAYDERLDRRVAIKLLRKRGSKHGGRRLMREAQALARVSHPNVVPIHDVGEFEQQPFLVMDLVEGVTLDRWLTEQERSRAEIIAVLLAAGRGLAAAHAKGVIHRDFKPENVMISREGRALVMDFGLARGDERVDSPPADGSESADEPDEVALADAAEAEVEPGSRPASSGAGRSGRPRASELEHVLTAAGTVMGTPGYMAPEQLYGQDLTDRCDQFSYCVTFWEALHGVRPFRGRSFESYARSIRHEPPQPLESNAVPIWLRRVLERGLAREPNDRWPSMTALLEAVQRDPTTRRRRVIFAVSGVLGLGLLVAGLDVADRRERERAEQARVDQLAACAREGEQLAEDWNEVLARDIERAFALTQHPFAGSAWQHTRPWLEGFAQDWSTVRTRTCVEATVEQTLDANTQADIYACLDEARFAFVGALEVFSGLTADDASMVTGATTTAAQLPKPSNCTNPSLLPRVRHPPEQLRDKLAALRIRLERARARGLAGDHERALGEAKAVLGEADASGWHPLITEAETLISLLHFRLHDFEAAKLAGERALLLATRSNDEFAELRAAAELTSALGGLAAYDEARRWGMFGEALLERLDLGGTIYESLVLKRLAAVLTDMGEHEQALVYQQRVLSIDEAVLGPEHPAVALLLQNLGANQDKLGHHQAALDSFARGIAIVEAVQGPEHVNLGYLYNSLAVTRKGIGDLAGALAAQQRALEIWEAAFGSEHPTVALAQMNLGATLCERNQCQAALELHERALAVFEAKLGPEHPRTGICHLRIGMARAVLGEYDQAIEQYRRALQIVAASKGADHLDALIIRINIASALRERGDAKPAVEELRAVLEVLERSHDLAIVTGPALVQLGLALLESGEITAASAELERALPMFDAVGDSSRADAQFALAQVRWASGDKQSAQALIDQAQAGFRAAGEFGTRGLEAIAAWQRGEASAQASAQSSRR